MYYEKTKRHWTLVVGILFLCHDQKVRRIYFQTFATEIVTFGVTRRQGQHMRREGSSAKVTLKARTLCSACDNQNDHFLRFMKTFGACLF